MPQIIDLAAYRESGRRRLLDRPPDSRATIHFQLNRDGTYLVTYEGQYAVSLPLAAEHLADALHQLTIEIRDA